MSYLLVLLALVVRELFYFVQVGRDRACEVAESLRRRVAIRNAQYQATHRLGQRRAILEAVFDQVVRRLQQFRSLAGDRQGRRQVPLFGRRLHRNAGAGSVHRGGEPRQVGARERTVIVERAQHQLQQTG